MLKKTVLCIISVFLIISALNCSGLGNGNPAVTSVEPIAQVGEAQSFGTQAVLGVWQVIINKDTGEIDIVQQRSEDMLLNVLSFMEPPPFSALNIQWDTLVLTPEENYLEVVVDFTHPFQEPDNVFVGFDVRGVVFGPEVPNADGYTPALSPQYFSGFPFGYMDGLLGAPKSYAGYNGDLWPYKYFAKDIDPYETVTEYYSDPAAFDDRGQFPEGETISRFYQLDFGQYPGSFLVFNYAVLASFDWPVGVPPYDLQDFSMSTCNAPEPFNISATVIDNNLFYGGGFGGGYVTLDVEVFDWQGSESTEVILSSWDGSIIPEVMPTSYDPGGTPYSTIFHFVDVPGTPTEPGDLDLMIKATDPSVTYGQAWMFGFLPPSNKFYDEPVYNIFPITGGTVEVAANEPPNWIPEIHLDPAYGTVARNHDQYDDTDSTYDSMTSFTYTGGEPWDPEGGGWTKYFYVSTSDSAPQGSPVGWTEFTTVGFFDVGWSFYTTIAPSRVYIWVRADDEHGAYSPPVRWEAEGGEIELCFDIKSFDNNFPSFWGTGGYISSVGQYLFIAVPAAVSADSWVYTKVGWIMGDVSTTSVIKVEFSRVIVLWSLSANELSLRVSNDDELNAIHSVKTWTGSHALGPPVVVTLPDTIGGTTTVGSTRAFSFYFDDLSTSSGFAYIDYVGIYAHPL